MMGSVSRSIRRKQEKKNRKDLKKKMNEQLEIASNMPQSCAACNDVFDKTDQKMLDEWRIVMTPDIGIRLYCPNCWAHAPENVE